MNKINSTDNKVVKRKNISILGSTGSIGTQTLDVCRKNKDLFEIEGLTTNKNIELLFKQIIEFRPKKVCIFDLESYNKFISLYSILKDSYKLDDTNRNISRSHDEKINITAQLNNDNSNSEIDDKLLSDDDLKLYTELYKDNTLPDLEIYTGIDGLVNIASSKDIDMLVTAVVGMIGLVPTVEAIKNSTTIALANKETLVTAGKIVMEEAKKHNAKILPVDSEHSAIFQCLNGEDNNKIDKILLTASGGPFRGMSIDELKNVTKKQALKHPNWSMGQKITIDSSTLMNKGLEVIEAKWLFDVDADDIVVHVHPQSIIHSMVQFDDSSVIAQLGCPDMRVPIQYALTYPDRIDSNYEKLDLFDISKLTFEKPDMDTFPCLKLAYRALREGGTTATVLNAANEVLVSKFLKDEIGFYDIPKYIEQAMDVHKFIQSPTLDDILYMDSWTRDYIDNLEIK